jgi:hypothetical protein
VSLDSSGAQADTDDTNDVAEVLDDPATTEDESVAPVDALPVGMSPAISGNGGTVAYASTAAMTPDDTNGVSDIYTVGLAGGMGRGSLVEPGDANAFEASGTRIDGHTQETVPASNGADPALTWAGNVLVFTSQGNLTGVASEEGEDSTGDETATGTSIEPNIYVRRPNPEPDYAAPTSHASSKAKTKKPWIVVRYSVSDSSGFPISGVKSVRLYVKKPGWKHFTWMKTDSGAGIDGVFRVKAGKHGIYKFYTVAVDNSGNGERRPSSGYDDKTRRR